MRALQRTLLSSYPPYTSTFINIQRWIYASHILQVSSHWMRHRLCDHLFIINNWRPNDPPYRCKCSSAGKHVGHLSGRDFGQRTGRHGSGFGIIGVFLGCAYMYPSAETPPQLSLSSPFCGFLIDDRGSRACFRRRVGMNDNLVRVCVRCVCGWNDLPCLHRRRCPPPSCSLPFSPFLLLWVSSSIILVFICCN